MRSKVCSTTTDALFSLPTSTETEDLQGQNEQSLLLTCNATHKGTGAPRGVLLWPQAVPAGMMLRCMQLSELARFAAICQTRTLQSAAVMQCGMLRIKPPIQSLRFCSAHAHLRMTLITAHMAHADTQAAQHEKFFTQTCSNMCPHRSLAHAPIDSQAHSPVRL